MSNQPGQFSLPLIQRGANEILSERLAIAVERFNTSTDPDERVALHAEIARLRRNLGIAT